MRHDLVASVGPATLGSVLWRAHGQLHLTIIAKATYAFRHDGVMTVCEPERLVPRDVALLET